MAQPETQVGLEGPGSEMEPANSPDHLAVRQRAERVRAGGVAGEPLDGDCVPAEEVVARCHAERDGFGATARAG